MKDFDRNLSLAENWQTADPLNFAWFEYAPSEMKERYRDAGRNPHLTATLKRLMEGEVQQKIGDGELVALGIRLEPDWEDSAGKVPPVLFQANSTSIDWDQGIVGGLDRRFAEVRVCRINIVAKEFPTPVVPLNLEPQSKARGRGGRRNLYPEARRVLEILYEDPRYRAMSAAAVLDVFNAKYLALHRPPDGKLSPASLRALQNYVRAYRQERAQTGKN